jgi:acetyltransferase-like isoleucine patch superfamily enzyme
MSLAPIALFVYRRPEHTRRTLTSLLACAELAQSPLYVFCDGAKTPDALEAVRETRRVAHALAPSTAIFVEREQNLGLAASIIGGVTQLCRQLGRVIVVEDDLEVSPSFLRYMNEGLERYADDDVVMQISGYQFPVQPPLSNAPRFFSFPTSWGWATWARAWQHFDEHASGYAQLRDDATLRRRFDLDGAYPYFAMLENQRAGRVDSWAIRWHLSVFQRDGLVLFPGRSLVKNGGLDGSGTHGDTDETLAGSVSTSNAPSAEDFPSTSLDRHGQEVVFNHLRKRLRFSRRLRALWNAKMSSAKNTKVRLNGVLATLRHWRAVRALDACGAGTRVLGHVEKRGASSRIEAGAGCLLNGQLVTEAPAALIRIGNNVSIGGETIISAVKSIIIEDDVLISYRCIINDSDDHSLAYSVRKADLRSWMDGHRDFSDSSTAPVRICKGAWIGAQVIITKGVTVGEGAVCGAGSVVTKDVAPYTVVAGNPARVIRELSAEER